MSVCIEMDKGDREFSWALLKEHLNTRYKERRGEEGGCLCVSRWTKETENSHGLYLPCELGSHAVI